jgi:hypothetical protein
MEEETLLEAGKNLGEFQRANFRRIFVIRQADEADKHLGKEFSRVSFGGLSAVFIPVQEQDGLIKVVSDQPELVVG